MNLLSLLTGACWMFLANLRPVQNHDFWWQLASGRYMVEHYTIPRFDVFSSTAFGSPWINGYWLYEIILYGAYCLGGLTAIILLKSLVVLLVFWFQERRMYEEGIYEFWRWILLAGVFLGAPLSSTGWSERADVVTLFFLSFLFWQLSRFGSRAQPRGSCWVWPLFFAVWANMHSGFVLGLVVAGWFALTKIFQGPVKSRLWLVWFLGCVGAAFIGPNGWKVFQMAYICFKSGHAIAEWQPPPWMHFKVYWILAPVFWAVFLRDFLRRRSVSLYEWGVSLFLTWGSMRYVLNVPFFMVCITPFLAKRLSDWTEFRGVTQWLMRRNRIVSGGAALLFALLAFHAWSGVRWGIQKGRYPVEACNFIERNGIRGTFFHPYPIGGYWMWRFGTERRVFIDGRYPTVAGYRPLWTELDRAQHGSPEAWQAFLRRYRVDGALLDHSDTSPAFSSVLARYFPQQEWVLVYRDDLSLVFLKRSAYPKALLK